MNSISQQISSVENELIIAREDWIVLLNFKIDIVNYTGYASRPRARKISEIIEDYKLVDVWREVCPETQGYTLRTCNTVKQGRLGYFLIPDTLLSEISGI